MTDIDIDTQKPLQSMISLLQLYMRIDRGMDLPRTKIMIEEFRALSMKQKAELIGLINKAASLNQFVLRTLLEDAIKHREKNP